jgi:hypothetical protein
LKWRKEEDATTPEIEPEIDPETEEMLVEETDQRIVVVPLLVVLDNTPHHQELSIAS